MLIASPQTAIQNEKADGGDDGPEDVATALLTASNADWKTSTRNVFLILDAPPHGKQYHSPSTADNFPNGDPRGTDLKTVIDKLFTRRVNLIVITTGSNPSCLDVFCDFAQKCYHDGKTSAPGPMGKFIRVSVTAQPSDFVSIIVTETATSLGVVGVKAPSIAAGSASSPR
jgi:hypothetical protein